jgi:glucose/arabinose dehydrogenase
VSPTANPSLLFGGLLIVAAGAFVVWGLDSVAQDPASLRGKVLRLRDDGSVPPDNPFAGRSGYRPEIYTLGHRNTLALIVHPVSGALWNHENGPAGGDEINVILPGRNYGWPLLSFGREYTGARISEHPTREGFEAPLVVWLPQIASAGMAVYTGDRFPAWKGSVFVGSLMAGRIQGTGHLQRIVFNEKTEEIRRESMLNELRQRIREVRQGPDGLLYLLTDEDDGALLRIEPPVVNARNARRPGRRPSADEGGARVSSTISRGGQRW